MLEMTKEQLRKNIGKNIRRERMSRNISIDEFASMLDLTPGFIGLMERGTRGTTTSCLYKVSAIFGVKIDTLFINHDDENELAEINNKKVYREKVSSLIFDFDEEELEYLTVTISSLRKLRGLPPK